MDKKIIDKLIQLGLITNTGIDASKYEDVDELIKKGLITVVNAKSMIEKALAEVAEIKINTPEVIMVETKTDEPIIVSEPEIEVVEPVLTQQTDNVTEQSVEQSESTKTKTTKKRKTTN